MSQTESFQISNQGAGTYGPYFLIGGRYQFDAVGTWGGGNIVLNQLGPDGSTYLSVSLPQTANGGQTIDIPGGTYQMVVTTATGVSAALTRIPLE